MINLNLLKEKNIDEVIAFDILKLQQKRDNILLQMHYLKNINAVKVLYKKIIDNEYKLQELWGFEKDSKYHMLIGKGYIPHCTCPYYDNKDLIGTDKRIYNKDCPIHGEYYKPCKHKNYYIKYDCFPYGDSIKVCSDCGKYLSI